MYGWTFNPGKGLNKIEAYLDQADLLKANIKLAYHLGQKYLAFKLILKYPHYDKYNNREAITK